MIIGLTGGMGSGKSTVANLFKNLGVPIFSADDIAREILDTDKTVQQAIVQKFGSKCLKANNTIDRHALGQIIFADQQSRLWLEALLHPLVAREFIANANNSTYPYCIVEIPLLIEAKMQDKVDRILTVDCTEEQQIKQALSRGRHNESEIKARIANQITRKERLAASDDIIENDYELASLQTRVKELHNFYLSLAADKNR
jgi:dephospho-CoA kinase